MKVGALTVVRNAAKYIIPHLQMYKGVDRNIVLFIKQPIYDWSQHYPEEPDNSLELIRKFCPEVEIFETETNHYGAPILNEGLELLSDCDVVIHLHADVILSPEEYQKLYDFIQSTDYNVYKIDMQKCWINYYYDFDHGVRDCIDVEPIACKSTNRYSQYWQHEPPDFTITFITGHHFNGWKGVVATKDWIQNRIPTESNIYARDLEQMGWLKCPEEIKKLFNENLSHHANN